MKNGRFSGKYSAKLLVRSSCAWSDSTWEKSGLRVALRVRLGEGAHATSRPVSTLSPSPCHSPSFESRACASITVNVGTISTLRPWRTPTMPSTLADWHSRQLPPRGTTTLLNWWPTFRGRVEERRVGQEGDRTFV